MNRPSVIYTTILKDLRVSGPEERGNGQEETFEKIIGKNSLNLRKDLYLQILKLKVPE